MILPLFGRLLRFESAARYPWRLGIMLGSTLLALACGRDDRAGSITTPIGTPARATPPPGIPQVALQAIDLRFQGVGAYPTGGLIPNDASGLLVGLQVSDATSVGSPLSIGANCTPGDTIPGNCAWLFAAYTAPPPVLGLSVTYNAFLFTTFDSALDTLTSGKSASHTVVTSLDLEPANNAYALSTVTTSQVGGFRLAHHLVAAGALQAAATQEGAHSRVITAVSFDSGQVLYLSYGWAPDTVAVYEANVVSATVATAPAVAQSLAAAGYIITALGGNGTDGLILVGTRVQGATAPHPLAIYPTAIGAIPGRPTSNGTLPAGYAIVGMIENVAVDSMFWIAEQ